MRTRTHREHIIAYIKHDLHGIKFSIGSGWEYWSPADVLRVLQMCGEIEKIINQPPPESLTPNKDSHDSR